MLNTPLFRIPIGSRQFAPSLLFIIAFFALLSVLLNLGLWQLDRAEEKEAIIAQMEQKLAEPERPLNQALTQANPEQSLVTVTGNFIQEQTIVVDNQQHGRQLGYSIFALFRATDHEQAIIVDRGWLPRKDFYEKVPSIPQAAMEHSQPMTLQGRLYYSKGDNDFVASNAVWEKHDDSWLIGQLDLKTIAEKFQKMGYDTAPFVIRQSPAENSAFIREWNLISSPPEKHIAYAIQWFAMAVALIVIFGFVNLKRVEKHDSTDR